MSITIGQIARRFTAVATTAVALTGLVAAAPASADPNFGAGNLPPMEITEGGTLDTPCRSRPARTGTSAPSRPT